MGRRVDLHGALVASELDTGGFWVSASEDRKGSLDADRIASQHLVLSQSDELFVIASPAVMPDLAVGQRVDLGGIVLALPRSVGRELTRPKARGERIYVYADRIDMTDN